MHQHQGSYIFVLGEKLSALMPALDEVFQRSKNAPGMEQTGTLELARRLSAVFSGKSGGFDAVSMVYAHEYIRRSTAYHFAIQVKPCLETAPRCFVITSFRCTNGDVVTRPAAVMPIRPEDGFRVGDTEAAYRKFSKSFGNLISEYDLEGYALDSIYQDLRAFTLSQSL